MDQVPAIFRWVLQTSLMASVLTAVILLIKYILGSRLGVRWHYAIWFIVVIRLMMPYAPQSALSVFNLFTAMNNEASRLEMQMHILNRQTEKAGTHQDGADFIDNEKRDKSDSTAVIVNEIEKEQGQTIKRETSQELSGQSQENAPIIEGDIKREEALPGTELEPGTVIYGIPNMQIHQAIYYIWLAGLILLGFYMLAMNIRFWLQIREEKTTTDDNIAQILDECKKLLRIRQRIEIKYTDFVKVPVLFGFINPKILLPESMKYRIPNSEMKYILLHELVHLKRKDVVVNWLTNILQVIHWFNPIIWLAFSKMREDREIACDAMVLYHLNDGETKKYGQTIISVLENYAVPVKLSGVTGILERKSQIKKRIKMIAGFNKKRYRWSLATILILMLMGCSMLTDPNIRNVNDSDKQIDNEMDMEATVLADTVSEDDLENWFIKAGYIARQGEWVYFYGLPLDRENGVYSLTSGPIYRIKLDGTDKSKVVDGNVEYVGIYEDWLYYKEEAALYRVNTKNGKKALLMQNTHGSTALDDEWIFVADKNGVIRMRHDGKKKEQLIDGYVKNIIAHDGWVYYTTNDSINRIRYDGTQRKVLAKGTVGNIQIWEDKLYFSVALKKTEANQPKTYYEGVLDWNGDTAYVVLDADAYRMNMDGTEKQRLGDGNLGEIIDGWLILYAYDDHIGQVTVYRREIDRDIEYRYNIKFLQEIWDWTSIDNNTELIYREFKIDNKWIYQCDGNGLQL